MFPLDYKEPYIDSTGRRSTLGEKFEDAGADVAAVKAALDDEIETRAALGAHNLIDGTIYNFVLTSAQTGANTFNTSANVTSFIAKIENNTDYIISKATGNRFYVALSADFPVNGGACNVLTVDNSLNKYSFNSGEYNYVMFYTNNAASSYDTIKPLLVLATDVYTTWSPYAMTNQELTRSLNELEAYSKSSGNGIVIERYGHVIHLYTDGVVATSNVIAQTVVSDSALRTKTQIASVAMLRDATAHTYAAHGCYVKTNGTIVFISENGTNIEDTTDFDYCTFDFMYFI